MSIAFFGDDVMSFVLVLSKKSVETRSTNADLNCVVRYLEPWTDTYLKDVQAPSKEPIWYPFWM